MAVAGSEEAVMKQVSQKAKDYLGQKLFDLYKEKHPTISADTPVTEVRKDHARYGLQIPELQHAHVFDLSPTATVKVVTIKPEDFETWATSKDVSSWRRLAYVEHLNRLYVAILD